MGIQKTGSAGKRTQLDLFLYDKSVYVFAVFFAFAIWAFWTTYYGRLSADIATAKHLHGIAMTLWCLMLIGQALLIRLKRIKIHKLTGKLSYVIVPMILATGVHLAHLTVLEIEQGTVFYYYFIALMYNALIVFAVMYGLAIWYRKRPLTHARYMLCTLIPILTPVTDRLIHKYFQGLIPLAPTLEGMPMVQVLGFALGDILVLGVLIWDWKAHKRLDVFPVALMIAILYHVSVITFYKFSFWRHIGDWIMSLPLS